MINRRLKAIANLVDNNSTALDVGCDHAYLSIDLIESNKCLKVYAIDNKIEPLNNAIDNIKKNKLEDRIIPILSDGLKNIDVFYDTIIIAGMGGETIIDILSYKEIKETLILEPNNNSKKVREFLMDNNYKIIDELIIKEKNVYYPIIKAIKTDTKIYYSFNELSYGPINLIKKEKELIDFLNLQKKILLKALENAKDKEEITIKLKNIVEVLNEIK